MTDFREITLIGGPDDGEVWSVTGFTPEINGSSKLVHRKSDSIWQQGIYVPEDVCSNSGRFVFSGRYIEFPAHEQPPLQ